MVASVVPEGFEAYIRILHSIGPRAESPRRWSEIARVNGRVMHRLAQYERISVPGALGEYVSGIWALERPEAGNIDREQLRALCGILARFSRHLDQWWLAVWEGWGGAIQRRRYLVDGPPLVDPVDAVLIRSNKRAQEDLSTSTFWLPDRQYYLYRGSVYSALEIYEHSVADLFRSRSPNLMWPDDNYLCVGTEPDFDSTIVGGPRSLIADILLDRRLEAWRVEPGDSLRLDGDRFN